MGLVGVSAAVAAVRTLFQQLSFFKKKVRRETSRDMFYGVMGMTLSSLQGQLHRCKAADQHVSKVVTGGKRECK